MEAALLNFANAHDDVERIAQHDGGAFRCVLRQSDMCCGLEEKTDTLVIDIEWLNHAVSYAQRTALYDFVLALLDEIEWTEGTGGKLVMRDEYNQTPRTLWTKGPKYA